MVRKFQGQRICSETDFCRPSSMILTAEDLSHIPDAFEQLKIEKRNKYGELGSGIVGSRLSRKFGGTIKLKQRLSSVPELFLHSINQPDLREKKVKRRLPTVVELKGKASVPVRLRARIRNERHFSSPLSQTPITNESLNNKYIMMPIKTNVMDDTVSATFSALQLEGNHNSRRSDRSLVTYSDNTSNNDLIFEEIMNLYSYSDNSLKDAPVLKERLDDFIDTVHESLKVHNASKISVNTKGTKSNLVPYIMEEDATSYDLVRLPHTPELRPESLLAASISSPEYTTSGGSDQSSCDEFSELGSIVPSPKSPCCTASDEELFYSCAEEVSGTSQISLSNDLHYSLRHTDKRNITPKVLTVEDMFGFTDEEEERSISSSVDVRIENYMTITDDNSNSLYSG